MKQRNLDWTPSRKSSVVHATDAGVEETSCQLACKSAAGFGGDFILLVVLPCTEERLVEPSPAVLLLLDDHQSDQDHRRDLRVNTGGGGSSRIKLKEVENQGK